MVTVTFRTPYGGVVVSYSSPNWLMLPLPGEIVTLKGDDQLRLFKVTKRQWLYGAEDIDIDIFGELTE